MSCDVSSLSTDLAKCILSNLLNNVDSVIAELRPGEDEEAAAPWTIEAGTRLEQREESRWRRRSS